MTRRVADLAGRSLKITFDGSHLIPTLWIDADGTQLGQGMATQAGKAYPMTLTIDHAMPFDNGTYGDQEVTFPYESGATTVHAIVQNFGSSSEAVLRKARERLDHATGQGTAPAQILAVPGQDCPELGARA